MSNPIDPKTGRRFNWGFYALLHCFGCGKLEPTPDPSYRLCPDCWEEWKSMMADSIDPERKLKTWEQVERKMGWKRWK